MPRTLDCGCEVNDYGQISCPCEHHRGLTPRERALVEIGEKYLRFRRVDDALMALERMTTPEERSRFIDAETDLAQRYRDFDARWPED